MRKLTARFLRDESGTTAIEYGLIVSLVFLVILSSLTLFGTTATGIFNKALNAISAVTG
jgi:pilus assembly protein Flp/PilA